MESSNLCFFCTPTIKRSRPESQTSYNQDYKKSILRVLLSNKGSLLGMAFPNYTRENKAKEKPTLWLRLSGGRENSTEFEPNEPRNKAQIKGVFSACE